MNAADVAGAALLLAGSAIALVAALGLHRLPDLYARMHAATKPATLGIVLCLAAAATQVTDGANRTKLALAVAFQLLTAPVAAHLLGRAAHRHGAEQGPDTVVDQLAGEDADI